MSSENHYDDFNYGGDDFPLSSGLGPDLSGRKRPNFFDCCGRRKEKNIHLDSSQSNDREIDEFLNFFASSEERWGKFIQHLEEYRKKHNL